MASSEEEWDEVGDGGFSAAGGGSARRESGLEGRGDANGHEGGEAEESADEGTVSAEKETRNGANVKRNTRKRGRCAASSHDDDDFESQPTITRWFRQVPGPLQDVMKQQHADLQQSMDDDGVVASGRSSGHIVHISTVFDFGPWVEMCDSVGVATTPGELYGGAKMSGLKNTVAHIQDDDQPRLKIPRLMVLIKSMRYIDEEIVAVFHDPSGEVDGYFHRDIVELVGPALVNGTAVLLRDVSVFTPSHFDVSGARKRYLNIIPRNVVSVFVADTIAKNVESIVRSFNAGQAKLIKAEEDAAEEEFDNQPLAQQPEELVQVDVRATTTELSFISQRQVIQRYQPVRADPNENDHASTTGKKKTGKEAPTGLGRWQWHQLAQKKTATANGEDDDPPAEVRRPVFSGRFTELLSQHIEARRQAANATTRLSPDQTSAPPTTTPASETDRTAEKADTATAKVVRFSTIQESNGDDFDDDDDW